MDPKEIVTLFRVVLKDAAKAFGRKEVDVTFTQFTIASQRRLGKHSMERCGGFSALKSFVTSNKKTPLKIALLKGKNEKE